MKYVVHLYAMSEVNPKEDKFDASARGAKAHRVDLGGIAVVDTIKIWSRFSGEDGECKIGIVLAVTGIRRQF